MTTSRPRSRRGSGEELREALITATATLLDTHELDDLSVRTVTSATGVSPTAMYLHFADLTELVHEVKMRFFATLSARLTAVANAQDPRERLRALAHAYLSYARDHPGHYAVIFHIDKRTDAAEEPPEDVVKAGFDALQTLFDTVREILGPQATDDAVEVGMDLWLSLHGRAQLSAAMPWFDLPDEDGYVDRLVTRVL